MPKVLQIHQKSTDKPDLVKSVGKQELLNLEAIENLANPDSIRLNIPEGEEN